MLDTVFNAFFQVVPFSFFQMVVSANFVIQFFYTVASRWDIV